MSKNLLENKSILIADDFGLGRQIMKLALAEFGGTQITEAEDGLDAIQKIKAAHELGKPFDLIFSDWNMPEATGIEVVTFLRSFAPVAKTPLILVTAVAEPALMNEAFAAGVSEYIVKPMIREDLETKLNRLFGGGLKDAV